MSVGLFDLEPGLWDPTARLSVARVPTIEAVRFIAQHHYAAGGGSSCICAGLYAGYQLVGVAAFGIPVSGDAANSVFGSEHHHRVMDLQRLVLLDEAPKNTESWFIVRALAYLKRRRPETWAVTSFADSTQGHVGTIYQATNAIYGGLTGAGVAYVDRSGVLHSDRLDGRSVSADVAAARGWTRVRRAGKHRYLYLLPDDRRHRRDLERLLRWQRLCYPKAGM